MLYALLDLGAREYSHKKIWLSQVTGMCQKFFWVKVMGISCQAIFLVSAKSSWKEIRLNGHLEISFCIISMGK